MKNRKMGKVKLRAHYYGPHGSSSNPTTWIENVRWLFGGARRALARLALTEPLLTSVKTRRRNAAPEMKTLPVVFKGRF